VINKVEAIEPLKDLPKLPVARVMWKPLPDMKTGCAAWILAGGAHHTCYSQNLSSDILNDFADIAGLEAVNIDANTNLRTLKNELKWSEAYYSGE
jgi:L-arabinose isomerase